MTHHDGLVGASVWMSRGALGVMLLAACPGVVGDLGDHASSSADGGGSGSDGGSDGGNDAGTDAGSGSASGSGSGGTPTPCDSAECGPAPGLPNYLCPDGETTAGPTGNCIDIGGQCSWEIVECPPCDPEDCGPAPASPNFLCPDGETVAGPGDCIEVDGMCVWDYVDCPNCCEPADSPICIEGSTCCEDGTWACNDGLGIAPCTEGTICSGGACADLNDSCAAGQSCCAGLMCCEGVPVPPGEEYCSDVCPISDRNQKQSFATVDPQSVLDKVCSLEITTWQYKHQDRGARHLGPMAQDFKAAFELGSTDKAIFSVDADGVALASIQALNQQLETLRRQNAALTQVIERLERRIDELERKR